MLGVCRKPTSEKAPTMPSTDHATTTATAVTIAPLAALEAHFAWRRAHGHAPTTLRTYETYLRRYLSGLDCLTHASEASVVTFLGSPAWGPEARKSAHSALRAFFRWAQDAELLEHDPMRRLSSPHVPAGVPRPAPDATIMAAMREAGPLVAPMLALARFAGLRVCEIARIHSRDYDRLQRRLYVRGKGQRERMIPISHPALHTWLATRVGWAFPSPARPGPRTAGNICKLISAALPEGITAHQLRHAYATAALRGTGNLLAVGRLLGHSRPETTQRYTLLDEDTLTATARAATASAVLPLAA